MRKYCTIAMFLCKAGYRFGSAPATEQAGHVLDISIASLVRQSLFLSM
jgi:hypothetical protein